MTLLRRHPILLAVLGAALLVGLVVPMADARLPRARAYRAGGPITLDTNLLSQSGASAWAIDAYLRQNTRLPPLGAAFMTAERTYGINARFLLAAAMHESGWGTSYLARVKHNLFGFNAYDRDPVRYANAYATYAANIDDTARFIKTWYLTPGGRWWAGQPTLRAMQLSWSSSGGWGSSVSRIATALRLATFAGRSIVFAEPVASGTVHPGEMSIVDLRWKGAAVPSGVQIVATWEPVQLDDEVAARTMAALSGGETSAASDAVAAGAANGSSPGPSASATSPGPSASPSAPGPMPAPGAAAPASVAATRIRAGDHDIGVRVPAPSESGLYLLDLEMRDAGGGPLPASEQAAIPAIAVHVWAERAVGYDIEPTADGAGAVIRVANTGLVPIPAHQVVTPASPRIPEVEIARSILTVTAWSSDPDDPAPVTLVSSRLEADLPPGAALAITVPGIAAATGRTMDWLAVGLTVLGDPAWLAAYPGAGAWFPDPGPVDAGLLGPAAAAALPSAGPMTSGPMSVGPTPGTFPTPSPSPAPTPSPTPAPSPTAASSPTPAAAPVTTIYQEHSGAIAYRGSWGDAPYAGYLGGNAAWSKTAGSTATFTFTGSSVSWIGPAGPTRGLALVLVDGQPITRVSLWRASFVARAVLFSRSFTRAARHTLTIEVLSMPVHPYVAIDAFQVRS